MPIEPLDASGGAYAAPPPHLFVKRLTTVAVKGTRLHEPLAVQLGEDGIEGDRMFYLVDDRGRPINGRRLGPLATVESSYDAQSGALTLRFPGRLPVSGVPRRTGASLVSDFFSHDVKGWLVEGPWSEVLAEHFGEDLRLMAADAAGEACDRHPLSIISSASISYLAAKAAGEGEVDHRRFRMMLEIGGCVPHQEDTWEGSVLELGSARIRVLEAIPRCSVIRQDPSTGLPNADLLKLLNRYRKSADSAEVWPVHQRPEERQVMFGRYGVVLQPGLVRVGDPVRVIPTKDED